MFRTRYLIVGATALSLTVAAAVGVAAHTPPPTPGAGVSGYMQKLAANLGIGETQLKTAIKTTATQIVDEKLAVGKITAEQSTRMKQRIAAGQAHFPGGHGRHGPGGRRGPGSHGVGPGNFAAIVGVDKQTLRTEIASGKTLAQIAEAHGKTRQQVKDAIIAGATTRLDKMVSAGRITAEQKQSMLQKLSQRIDKMLDATHQHKNPNRAGRPNRLALTATP